VCWCAATRTAPLRSLWYVRTFDPSASRTLAPVHLIYYSVPVSTKYSFILPTVTQAQNNHAYEESFIVQESDMESSFPRYRCPHRWPNHGESRDRAMWHRCSGAVSGDSARDRRGTLRLCLCLTARHRHMWAHQSTCDDHKI